MRLIRSVPLICILRVWAVESTLFKESVLSYALPFAITWPFTIQFHSHLASRVKLSSDVPERALCLAEEKVEVVNSTMEGS